MTSIAVAVVVVAPTLALLWTSIASIAGAL